MFLGLTARKRSIVVATGLLGVLAMSGGLAACGKKDKAEATAKPAAHASVVEAAIVSQTTAPVQITGTGTVAAWQEAPVGAEVGGLTAVAVLVDEGQSVTQGQPLLKMDDVLLQAQYKQAHANFDQANKAYQRAQTLYNQGYISAAGLDTAQASKLTTEAALATAQVQLAHATVRAPVAGIVTSRKAVLGQIVTSGNELFRIVRDGRIELNMEVVDTDLHAIKPGMTATVTSDSTGPVTGTVRIVTPQVDPSTRLGYARISLPWSSGLRPGMFASGSIGAGMQTVLIVPSSAIVYSNNQSSVYVVGSDKKAHLRKVSVGATAANKTVVIKDGLSAGETVVTTGAGFLNDGDLVKTSVSAQTGGEH